MAGTYEEILRFQKHTIVERGEKISTKTGTPSKNKNKKK